jgi:hypothetical protein
MIPTLFTHPVRNLAILDTLRVVALMAGVRLDDTNLGMLASIAAIHYNHGGALVENVRDIRNAFIAAGVDPALYNIRAIRSLVVGASTVIRNREEGDA